MPYCNTRVIQGLREVSPRKKKKQCVNGYLLTTTMIELELEVAGESTSGLLEELSKRVGTTKTSSRERITALLCRRVVRVIAIVEALAKFWRVFFQINKYELVGRNSGSYLNY